VVCVNDVYNYFKHTNMNEILKTKEDEIVSYIENNITIIQVSKLSYVIFINVIKF
jgi:hypothetical protein